MRLNGHFDMLPDNAFRTVTGRPYGKLMTLEGGKGGSAPPPDTNPGMIENAEAARDVAKMQQDTATEYLNFAKTQYNDNKQFLADIAQAEAAMMKSNQQRAEEYAAYERDTFRPMEKELIGKAKAYNEDAMRERMASQSAADTNAAYDSAKQQALRNLARYGINPNSGRFAALNAQIGTQQAGAIAAGQNQARTQAEGLGYARMQDAVALGKGLAPNASTAYGIAIQGGDSASKNSQAGANYMGQAYNQAGNQLGNAGQTYGVAGNIYGQEFNARMQGYSAQQQANAQSSAGFGQLVGTGIGVAAKLGVFSSKKVKENKKAIPEGKALKGIKNLDVEEWDYKKGVEDSGHHVGPYAEDFKREFGVGDGVGIKHQDAMGVMMKAIQDLDAKVERLGSRNQGKPVKKANGGKVHRGKGKVKGPGGPVDDKIPAMLSNGEYVLPADTVSKVGIKNLDKLVKTTHVPAEQQRKYGLRRA